MVVKMEIRSEPGLVRESNEDMGYIYIAPADFEPTHDFVRNESFSASFEDGDPIDLIVMAVADGMGGHRDGEKASEFILKDLNNNLASFNSQSFDLNKLVPTIPELVNNANRRLLNYGRENLGHEDLGTTLAAAVFYVPARKGLAINVGDSRIYRLRGGFIKQFSTDQTLSEKGENSHILTTAFGQDGKISPDITELGKNIAEGDIFLICSDGLTGELSLEEIEVELNRELSLGDKADNLILQAEENGGGDNISIAVIEFA